MLYPIQQKSPIHLLERHNRVLVTKRKFTIAGGGISCSKAESSDGNQTSILFINPLRAREVALYRSETKPKEKVWCHRVEVGSCSVIELRLQGTVSSS